MAYKKKEVYKVKPMTEGKRNIIQGLLQEYDIETAEDIQAALRDLLGGTIKEMMEAEMDDHLGYEKSERSDNDDYRNSHKKKRINSSFGSMEIDVPQDRKSTFEPQVVKKRQKDISEIDQRIISMYAKGMTIRRISDTLMDIYGFEASEGFISDVTDKLKYAVKIDLIDVNPADKVERPKKNHFVGNFYDADEINALFEVAKGTKLELPILLGAFYGLRRSEVIGLKWDAIDFEQNTITIRHTVTSCNVDGKFIMVASDTTKTKSSRRTLPLVPFMRERLLNLKEEQEENRRLCGRSYKKEYIGYVCVNEIGDLIKPHYVTDRFPKLLEANGLRHIRFHDLRHSCASLLLANGVPMKQIQEWLGHSDYSTTANIYAYLDYSSKLTSADAMLNGLGFERKEKGQQP